MNPNEEDKYLKQGLKERFQSLPKQVQNAITSADVEEHLRTLANVHKLHIDQWQTLENNVMMTLLGFQKPEDLEANLHKDLGTDAETSKALAADISQIVFDPIRKELERELDNPEAQAKEVNAVENFGAQAVASEAAAVVPAPIGKPPEAPETKAVRAPVSEAYKTGEASTVRKDVHNDPYREPPA